MLTTSLDSVQFEYASNIGTSAKLLLGVLNDILDYSKLESHKVALECNAFDLRQCIEQEVGTFRHEIERKKLELIVHIPHTCPPAVCGDETRLRQVLKKSVYAPSFLISHSNLRCGFWLTRLFCGVSASEFSEDMLD